MLLWWVGGWATPGVGELGPTRPECCCPSHSHSRIPITCLVYPLPACSLQRAGPQCSPKPYPPTHPLQVSELVQVSEAEAVAVGLSPEDLTLVHALAHSAQLAMEAGEWDSGSSIHRVGHEAAVTGGEAVAVTESWSSSTV